MSLVIEEGIIEEALQKIEELNTLLDFLITLTKEERNRCVLLDSANKLFVDEALGEGKLRPTLVPSFINLAEAEKDFNAFSKLIPVRNSLDTFLQKLHDTTLVLGDDGYNHEKVPAKIPDAVPTVFIHIVPVTGGLGSFSHVWDFNKNPGHVEQTNSNDRHQTFVAAKKAGAEQPGDSRAAEHPPQHRQHLHPSIYRQRAWT